jgi:hypothetical protein
VITHNRERGERIAERIESGGVCINDFGLCYMNQNLPFGGSRYSGYGVMNGRDGLRAYTTPKAILSDRFSFEIPPKLFPVGSRDYESAKASMRMLFGSGLTLKVKNFLAFLGISILAKLPKAFNK